LTGARAVPCGAIHPRVDPETAALRLTSLMDGLQLQWLLDRSIDIAGALVEWMTPAGLVAFEGIEPAR